MKKLTEKLKKRLNRELTIWELGLYTFSISLMIMGFIYILNKISPFGDKSLLQVDFYHQYGPMLGELYDRVHSFSNLIYSFKMGLGLPFFRNFFNYMSSPLNIIMFFFRRKDIVTSFSIIIGLKPVLSSVTMVYYLSKKYKTTELYLIPFGLLYAFSAYFSAYYWNLMWIDGMIFLPLISLGIEQIIDSGKWKLYTISLALMLFDNYYIGYMLCIFSCLYFFIYSFSKFVIEKGKIKDSFKRLFIDSGKFIWASMLAGGICAVFLLPLFFSISSISATGGSIPTSQYYLFSVSDFFKYHFSGITPTVFASGNITAPNVSCGILVFALLIIFILNVFIPFKEKLGYVLLFVFFILAFFWAPIDYILQAFHVPNDLPYRYSFIYSFVLILISVFSFKNIKKINYRLVILVYLLLSIVLLIMGSSNYVGMSENMVYVNMALLSIYFIIYSLVSVKRINLRLVYIIMIFLVVADVILSINKSFKVYQHITSFYDDYDNISNKINYIKDNDSSLFYRIEKVNRLTLNDSSWYNYNGVTSFSSMNYEAMAILQRHLGMAGNYINSYIYSNTTPIYDTMFDIKYIIDNYSSLNINNNRYVEINSDDGKIYKYNYNVGVGYGVNKDILKWKKEYVSPFETQNEYIALATGINGVLEPIKILHSEVIYNDNNEKIIKYTLKNSFDDLYFYCNNYNVDFMIINNGLYYNNNNYLNYTDTINALYHKMEDYNEKRIIKVNSLDDDIIIYVGYNYYSNDIDNVIDMYTINNDKFTKAINKFERNKLMITSFKETKIEGNVTLEDDMVMYTSIPYDIGWHVLVDGKRVETTPLARSLLTFPASKGSHKVVIYYRAKGLWLGIIFSVISIVMFFGNKFFLEKIKKFLKKCYNITSLRRKNEK